MPIEEFRYADRETGPLKLRVFDVPLVGLSSNGFGNGPRMPMVPGTWGPEASEGEGDHS